MTSQPPDADTGPPYSAVDETQLRSDLKPGLLAIVRICRRHAFLMTGNRDAGDRRVIEAFARIRERSSSVSPTEATAELTLIEALTSLYAVLPRTAPYWMGAENNQLKALPFHQRAALVLSVIEKLPRTAAAQVLLMQEPAYACLLALARAELSGFPAATGQTRAGIEDATCVPSA